MERGTTYVLLYNAWAERVDDMVLRILRPMFAMRLFDTEQPTGNLSVNVRSQEHTDFARHLAEASTVLLKNQGGLLPLNLSRLTKYSNLPTGIPPASLRH